MEHRTANTGIHLIVHRAISRYTHPRFCTRSVLRGFRQILAIEFSRQGSYFNVLHYPIDIETRSSPKSVPEGGSYKRKEKKGIPR